jgi:hypothetical protein
MSDPTTKSTNNYSHFPGILVMKANSSIDIIKARLSEDVVQIIIHPESIYDIHLLLSQINHELFEDGYDIMYSKIIDNTYYVTIGDIGQKKKNTTSAVQTKQPFSNVEKFSSNIENLIIKYVCKKPKDKADAVMSMDIKSIVIDEPVNIIFMLSIISILLVLLFALVLK